MGRDTSSSSNTMPKLSTAKLRYRAIRPMMVKNCSWVSRPLGSNRPAPMPFTSPNSAMAFTAPAYQASWATSSNRLEPTQVTLSTRESMTHSWARVSCPLGLNTPGAVPSSRR